MNKTNNNNKTLREAIRKEIKQALNEGALLKAINPSLEGEVKQAVINLEKYLLSIGAIQDYKHAKVLAELVIDIIDAAKEDERIERPEW
jgi:DNA polymerase III delta prime subunit